jgi:hypothetical protein
MGLFGFGKRKENYLTVITLEGGGKLRINGVRSGDQKSKKTVIGHGQTVCWIEFAPDGIPLEQGVGPAAKQAGAGRAEKLLRDLPTSPACRGVLERLRDGQESVGKWLDVGEPVRK